MEAPYGKPKNMLKDATFNVMTDMPVVNDIITTNMIMQLTMKHTDFRR